MKSINYNGKIYSGQEGVVQLMNDKGFKSLNSAFHDFMFEPLASIHFLLANMPEQYKNEEFSFDKLIDCQKDLNIDLSHIDASMNIALFKIEHFSGLFNLPTKHFSKKSLEYNILSIDHNDFAKNLSHFYIHPLTQENFNDEKNISAYDINRLLKFNEVSHQKEENYKALLNFVFSQTKEDDTYCRKSMSDSIFKNKENFLIAKEMDFINTDSLMSTYNANVKNNVLQCAVRLGTLELVRYLVEDLNMDINTHNERSDGFDLLSLAAENRDKDAIKIMDYLLNNHKFDLNRTYLEQNNTDNTVVYLIESGTKPPPPPVINAKTLIENLRAQLEESEKNIKQEKFTHLLGDMNTVLEKEKLNQVFGSENKAQEEVKPAKKRKI
jgi:hypothetical protein